MPYKIESIHAEQGLIVRELFVDTADDNYITARWCFVEGLNVDYFWLAVHALEKYMKASLLLNGHSAKGYLDHAGKRRSFGHDITKLYGYLRSFAADLLPDNLPRPVKSEHCWIFVRGELRRQGRRGCRRAFDIRCRDRRGRRPSVVARSR